MEGALWQTRDAVMAVQQLSLHQVTRCPHAAAAAATRNSPRNAALACSGRVSLWSLGRESVRVCVRAIKAAPSQTGRGAHLKHEKKSPAGTPFFV